MKIKICIKQNYEFYVNISAPIKEVRVCSLITVNKQKNNEEQGKDNQEVNVPPSIYNEIH